MGVARTQGTTRNQIRIFSAVTTPTNEVERNRFVKRMK
jgi:hypothetical protein